MIEPMPPQGDASVSPERLTPLAKDPTTMALAWRGVRKQYDQTLAVSDLNLDIPKGSFYGVVGPNGAGKTTAIMIATGLLRPDHGQVFIDGHSVWGDGMVEAKRAYGLLADGIPIFDRLTGAEYLDYLGRLRGLKVSTIKERSTELLDALDLTDASQKMIVDYSAGMTKKILLAGALLHRPSLLILDEPLESVDPVSARMIRAILQRFVSGGGTVMMSSHVMEVVESLCDHVALIADGTVRASGTTVAVCNGGSLADAFVAVVGARDLDETTLMWLSRSSDTAASGGVRTQETTQGFSTFQKRS